MNNISKVSKVVKPALYFCKLPIMSKEYPEKCIFNLFNLFTLNWIVKVNL